jgi:hypothetical protein
MAFVTDMTEQKKALSLAGEVQRSLLPDKAPLIPGLEVAGRNVPCDEVGGDYFDYLWNGDLYEGKFTVVADITEPVDLRPFRPISALCEKNNPRTIKYMSPVIFPHALISNENSHKSTDS